MNADSPVIDAILCAHGDISHWISFAERQLREIPLCDYIPSGPSMCGIEESRKVLNKLEAALAFYRAVA